MRLYLNKLASNMKISIRLYINDKLSLNTHRRWNKELFCASINRGIVEYSSQIVDATIIVISIYCYMPC